MPAMRHIKRIDECRDAIVNMHVNGISNGQISRTLRIAMPTVRRILDEWKAQAGAIARAQARFAGMVDPACDTIERAIKRDDKAAFRLVEGLGVLGGHNSSIATDKSISISVNTLLATTQPSASDDREQPSSRKGPTPQVQLQEGEQNFSEIPQLVDNKGVARIPGYVKNMVQHVADDFDAPMTLGEGDANDEQFGQFTGESCGDGDDPSRE